MSQKANGQLNVAGEDVFLVGGSVDFISNGNLRFGGQPASIRRGETTLDGANPTVIDTNLQSIAAVFLTLKGSAAPGLGTSLLTYTVGGGQISVHAWKPTDATNPTLIASTGTETFAWIAFGEQ